MKTKPVSARRPLLILVMIYLSLAAVMAGASALAETADDYDVYFPITMRLVLPSSGGTLDNEGVFVGIDGVGIGALSSTLTQTIDVEIGMSSAPTLTLPSMVQGLGDYYGFAAGEDIYVSPDSPFIVAFPVPAGAMTSSLALASLSSGENVDDAEANMQAWSFLEGMYDPDQNLFLTTISGLTSEGRTFILVEHPDLASPPNNTAPKGSGSARPTAAQVQFNVKCTGFDLAPGLCTSTEESAVAGVLSDAYDRIQGDFSYAPPPPPESGWKSKFRPKPAGFARLFSIH